CRRRVLFDTLAMPAENTVTFCGSSGSGPTTAFNSLICYRPISASPCATISPTGVAGIFLTVIARSEATKQSIPPWDSGLLRSARNDGSRAVVGSRIDVHEIPQQGIDLVVPAPAAEHAVMPDAGLHVMYFAVSADTGAQVLRGQRLADRADVVLLALDRHQAHALDRGGLNRPAAIGQLAHGQEMFLKNVADGFNIKLRRQIHYREIFVVECL